MTPLVRDDIGDIGTYTDEPCACGSPLPRISKLVGRDRDLLFDLEGNPKPGYLFVEVINKFDIPGKFQFIQESERLLIANVVKLPGFSEKHVDIIKKKFADILGNGVEIRFEYVSDIKRLPSGKYRYTYSKIGPYAKQTADAGRTEQ